MATGRKHASCITHPKLACGCKVCETPTSTAHTDRLGLAGFHAYIHELTRQHLAARPRLPGDGRVDLDPKFTQTRIGTDIPPSRFVGAA